MDLSLRFWPRIDGRRLLRFGLLSLLGWSSHWFMVATQEILEVQWSRKKKSFKVHFARLDFAKNFHSGFRKQLPNVSLNPLGKYRESPHLKIPSGLWRRKLGLEQTFVNFQSCQRCKKKVGFYGGMITALFFLFSVLRKEFEVPPYSQSVELGSQIQLRCHPPKGVPKPRVRMMICWLLSIGYAYNDKFPLGLSKLFFPYRFTG